MATTKTRQNFNWNNFHQNGPFFTKALHSIKNDKQLPDLTARYNDAGQEIQRLLQDCMDNNQRFRAIGSGWSFSNIAHQKDRMLHNSSLNIKQAIAVAEMHPNSQYKAENLFFFQCGNTIKEISEFLFESKKSLKTCGASNGQTIAGAISTGVHGSAFEVGSVQDCVVGINLIIGPGQNDIVYLERASRPALKDDFAASIHARVIRDDAMFNAALVGLGSFGVVHGVVIEAEDLYLLKRYIKKIKKADAMFLAQTMDFSAANLLVPEETNADGTNRKPFHFKYIINAYSAEDMIMEIVYKNQYSIEYENPRGLIEKSLYKDLTTLLVKFAAKHKGTIPFLIDKMKEEAFPTVDSESEGTLGEIFWDTNLSNPSMAGSFGLNIANASKALDIFIDLMKHKGPIPGFLSMRFVKASEATLAFTKFPITCVLEVDCLTWKPNDNIISFDAFVVHIIEAFKANDIPFTMHWGKNAPWAYPNLVDDMYGTAADDWKNMRNALLSEQMADVFTNDYLENIKLSNGILVNQV